LTFATGLKTIIEDEQNLLSHSSQNKALIFAFNPHDILPYAVFAFSPFLRRLPGKLNDDGACLMTSAIFNIPFMRQVYSWTSALPVDKRTFLGRLNRGESFAFVPGGVQEVIMLDPNRPEDVVLFLKNRKGFVKLALSTGSPIVPVFGFNLDGSYGYWFPRHPYIEKLARSIGFLPLVFWGRWFVPFGIPRPKRISVVIGPAIDVPKFGEEVNQDVIDKYHDIFLKELEALFERHKHEAGYGERKLKIV
jgi:2-acylglycerol O-acyltransferase 2